MARKPRKSRSGEARRALRSSTFADVRRTFAPESIGEHAEPFKPSGHAAIAAIESIPDLFNIKASLALDGPGLCGALDYAFAGGSCLDALETALDESPLSPSDWNPDSFVQDLFVDRFVTGCMRVTLDGWEAPINRKFLSRVLCSPPADRDLVLFRRAILEELSQDEDLRGRFESLYRKLCRLRSCFAIREGGSHYEETRLRVETLAILREAVEAAADGFDGAGPALSRIGRFGSEVKAGEGYRRLGELLEYENDLARVDVQVQLGFDGRVRRFGLIDLKENEKNRFHVSPLRRFLGKLGLYLRGYRFSSDELVELWLDQVFEGIKHFIPPMIQLLGQMELYLASLSFRDLCKSKGLSVCFAELADDGRRQVRGLFNPLLFEEDVVPVPSNLESDTFETISIVTGPNSGGKTRLLQAVGLAQVLAQSGLFVPAKKARLRISSGLFVSLVGLTDPRPEPGEGRLGTELIRIRRMFEESRPGALLIIDEFCSGTNPSEGEEIFYLVLTLLPGVH